MQKIEITQGLALQQEIFGLLNDIHNLCNHINWIEALADWEIRELVFSMAPFNDSEVNRQQSEAGLKAGAEEALKAQRERVDQREKKIKKWEILMEDFIKKIWLQGAVEEEAFLLFLQEVRLRLNNLGAKSPVLFISMSLDKCWARATNPNTDDSEIEVGESVEDVLEKPFWETEDVDILK